jgi:hypothetical protein
MEQMFNLYWELLRYNRSTTGGHAALQAGVRWAMV